MQIKTDSIQTASPNCCEPETKSFSMRLAGLWQSWRARREIAGMARLDDRLLDDIGLTRADVDWALMRPLGENPSAALAGRVSRRRKAELWARRFQLRT